MATKLQRKCCNWLPPATGQHKVFDSGVGCFVDTYWTIDGIGQARIGECSAAATAPTPCVQYNSFGPSSLGAYFIQWGNWVTPTCDAKEFIYGTDGRDITHTFAVEWFVPSTIHPPKFCATVGVNPWLTEARLNGTVISDMVIPLAMPHRRCNPPFSWQISHGYALPHYYSFSGIQKGQINRLEFDVRTWTPCDCPGSMALAVQFWCQCSCCETIAFRDCYLDIPGLIGTGMPNEDNRWVYSSDLTNDICTNFKHADEIATEPPNGDGVVYTLVPDNCFNDAHWKGDMVSYSYDQGARYNYPDYWVCRNLYARCLSATCVPLHEEPPGLTYTNWLDFWVVRKAQDLNTLGVAITIETNDLDVLSIDINGHSLPLLKYLSWRDDYYCYCHEGSDPDCNALSNYRHWNCHWGLIYTEITDHLQKGRNRITVTLNGIHETPSPYGWSCVPQCFCKDPSYHWPVVSSSDSPAIDWTEYRHPWEQYVIYCPHIEQQALDWYNFG